MVSWDELRALNTEKHLMVKHAKIYMYCNKRTNNVQTYSHDSNSPNIFH
jgi:hypothetical protein